MRPLVRGRTHHVCLPCRLGVGRQQFSHTFLSSIDNQRQAEDSSASSPAATLLADVPSRSAHTKTALSHYNDASAKNRSLQTTGHASYNKTRRERRGRSFATKSSSKSATTSQPKSSIPDEIVGLINAAETLKARLQHGLDTLQVADPQQAAGVSLEDVLKASALQDNTPDEEYIVHNIRKAWKGKAFLSFSRDVGRAVSSRALKRGDISDEDTRRTLRKLGILDTDEPVVSKISPSLVTDNEVPPSSSIALGPSSKQTILQSLASVGSSTQKQKIKNAKKASNPSETFKAELVARELQLVPLGLDEDMHIPSLSFDLSRVLFNPGVYQLRDARSRVYNFDPYLEQPMPMSEFNFDALNQYVTSSKDSALIELAQTQKKRYIGSSSSMSSALSQFHFLLSQFRLLNVPSMSRGFKESNRLDYTVITKAPATIFLRWRNGVYAVDADKEFDEPNLLMGLGKSLEKLLTLEKADFEKWRKTNTAADKEFSDSFPEAYHYSGQGKFLLRSQLDARDPRLPGSGVFDLKTRAVAGIRLNIRDHELGRGYEIKDRFGTWESYEREYYDMARAAFLKYSMQVRMGNMDGIFVAYHNIQRIFGFQYIPLSELDLAIHGTKDPELGNEEFRLSIEFLEQIFDKVTAQFPEQSIRFHFETRDASTGEPKPHMQIFAEPWSDSDIDTMSAATDRRMAEYERKLFSGKESEVNGESAPSGAPSEPAVPVDHAHPSRHSDNSDANPDVIDKILARISPDAVPTPPRPLMAFKLRIRNKVNGMSVERPSNVSPRAKWSVAYEFEQVEESLGRRAYTFCKNRRMAALKTRLDSNNSFYKQLRGMSERGALWRQGQDALDAQQEKVVLYHG